MPRIDAGHGPVLPTFLGIPMTTREFHRQLADMLQDDMNFKGRERSERIEHVLQWIGFFKNRAAVDGHVDQIDQAEEAIANIEKDFRRHDRWARGFP